LGGRPEILYPLFAPVATLEGVGPRSERLFAALDVTRLRDLLFLLPTAGQDRRRVDSIREVTPPALVTLEVTVGPHRPPRRPSGPYRVQVADAATEFFLVWFHARA